MQSPSLMRFINQICLFNKTCKILSGFIWQNASQKIIDDAVLNAEKFIVPIEVVGSNFFRGVLPDGAVENKPMFGIGQSFDAPAESNGFESGDFSTHGVEESLLGIESLRIEQNFSACVNFFLYEGTSFCFWGESSSR